MNKDQTEGTIKKAVGDLTGDEDLTDKGKAQKAAGDVKEVVEEAKDKVEGVVDAVTDKLTKH